LLDRVSIPPAPEENALTKNGNERSELWMELAEMASQEDDPEKLVALVTEINRLLERKQGVAKGGQPEPSAEIIRLLERKQALLNDGSTKTSND